ncbi:MAG: hypothetical protein AMXMBFR80_04470 [Dehalococcoidia bacterium]
MGPRHKFGRRLAKPNKAEQDSGRGDGTLAIASVNAALEVALAAGNADVATNIDALAYTLHVVDRYAFAAAGKEVRSELMESIVPASTILLLTILGRMSDPPADDLEERDIQNVLAYLDGLNRQFAECAALYPGDGIPRPTVLELAHLRLIQNGPVEQDAEFQEGLLLAMMQAVQAHHLQEVTRAVAAKVAAEINRYRGGR